MTSFLSDKGKLKKIDVQLCLTVYLPSIAGILIMAGGLQAFADERANFAKLIEEPSKQELVLMAAKRSPVVLQNPCPAAKFTLINDVSIYKPLEFDQSNNITAGAWQQSVTEEGCGQKRLLKVLMYFSPQSKCIKGFPLFPGTTHTDPILQKDAINHAVMAASSPELVGCKLVYVANTEFLRFTGNPLMGAKGKPWDELWTLNICTKKAVVTMHFIPDSTGTTIRTCLAETKFFPMAAK
jgi:hypothetical protein